MADARGHVTARGMQANRGTVMLLATLVGVAACRGSTAPSVYPNIQGVWSLDLTVDGAPGSAYDGQLVIIVQSQKTPEFTGSYRLDLTVDTPSFGLYTGPITRGCITSGPGEDPIDIDIRGSGGGDFAASGESGQRAFNGTWSLSADRDINGSFRAVWLPIPPPSDSGVRSQPCPTSF